MKKSIRTATLLGAIYLTSMPITPAWAQELSEFQATSPILESAAHAKCAQQNRNDPRALFECMETLAATGDASAQTSLGYFLFNGRGAVRDAKRAADVWELAVAQGHPTAMSNLAIIRATGIGRPRDLEKANSLRSDSARILGTTVPALHVAGQFNGGDYPSPNCWTFAAECKWIGETIVATYTVEADGSVKTCQGIGESEILKQTTCKIIQNRFRFLPAMDKTGNAISFETSQNVNWNPPPQRPDRSAPAKLVSGRLSMDMVPKALSAAESGAVELKLALRVDKFARITGCKATGGSPSLMKWACQQARRTLRIEPAKSPGANNVESNLELAFQLNFAPAGGRNQPAPPASAPLVKNTQPPTQPKSSEPEAATPDANLETAISRCKRIGFKEGEASFRECVLEQIRLLSAAGGY